MPSSERVREAGEVVAVIEREYRFVPAERLPYAAVTQPLWHDYQVRPLPTEEQTNTYLDTADQALARRGISFRRRVVGNQAELTLKLPRQESGGPLFARPEYSESIGIDEALAGQPLLAMAERYSGGAAIGPWFTFQTNRRAVMLATDAATMILTWDRLSLPDDPDFVDAEIEAELATGPIEVLDALADLLIERYGLRFGVNGKRTRVGHYLAAQQRIRFPSAVAPGTTH